MPDGTDHGNGNNGSPQSAGGGGNGAATVSLPGYVKDNLGKDVAEALTARVQKEPEFAKRIPATLGDLWKSWDSAQTDLSTALRRPADGASREEWDSFYAKLGRPNSPKDYAFDKPDLPKGMAYDLNLIEQVAQAAFEEGVPDKALKKIFATFNGYQIKQFQDVQARLEKEAADKKAARQKARDDSLEANRKRWGANYDANLALVKQVFVDAKRIPPALQKRIMDADLDNDPDMQNLLLLVARRTSEDRKLGLSAEAGGEGTEEETPKLDFPNTRKRFPVRSRR